MEVGGIDNGDGVGGLWRWGWVYGNGVEGGGVYGNGLEGGDGDGVEEGGL